MRRVVLLLSFILACSFASAQEINFINELANKEKVSFGEGVRMFLYTLGKVPAGFEANVRVLRDMKLLKFTKYDEKRPLRRGMVALMVARHLKLKSSLFFLMFDTERYALRACMADEIMAPNTSELDTLTGDELLEVMALVSERMEAQK
ncbi:MAG: hypothetical protein JW807_17045 [Spirochaetes bacterium]|nr:hypothetical protein [Spirochaetota bacterium]